MSSDDRSQELNDRIDQLERDLQITFTAIHHDFDTLRNWLWVIGGIVGGAVAMIVINFISERL